MVSWSSSFAPRVIAVALGGVLGFGLSAAGCQRKDDQAAPKAGSGLGSGAGQTVPQHPKVEQVPPPVDIKNPPADAIKTPSGLIYKKLVTNDAGQAPGRNDTVVVHFTGWKQTTGETFNTTRNRQPQPLPLASAAPGFTEGLQLIRKGEKAMLWVPPSLGYKGPPQGTPETLVYEVEVIDIQAAPAVPADVAKPPDTAEQLKSGTRYLVLKPGTGKDKPRPFDSVTFNYSAWAADGRMIDSTELHKRPATVPPFRQPAALEEMLVSLTVGERARFWVAAEKLLGGKPVPGAPTGLLCYELELVDLKKGAEPPPTPKDVAAAPADAKKTAKGVAYKILKPGKGGPHPGPNDTVRLHYTGWTTDGRMFDSSVIRSEPAEFSLAAVIAGWTDGIPMLSVGDKARLWIPDTLAYKGSPNKPQGMLVFDLELLEIKAAATPPPHKP
jgi:FKBP-type peptidyl-prolyl cis-trans isomerase